MRAVLSCVEGSPQGLVEKAREWPGLVGQDMVRRVTCQEPYDWSENEELSPFWQRRSVVPISNPGERVRVVAMDFGIKFNILRILQSYGCSVTVVPATATAPEILGRNPDGVFLSNGPGDPAAVTYAIHAVRDLLGKVPVFGICLGHQLMGLAAGGQTFKLKFGHRGANQPVKDLLTGRVYITSQNHGFAVDPATLPSGDVRLSHVNLNDQTVEGLDLPGLDAFSVQHHPEASPGPHDHMRDLFGRFMRSMRGENAP
jgi:carbamoyl-phosphate synthase small subunit